MPTTTSPTDPDRPADGLERGQLPLDLGHVASHDEADFVVGEGNRLAYLHLVAFPDWPGPLTLLMGPPKSGKSHLARIWIERAGAATPAAADLGLLAAAGGTRPLLLEDVDRAGFEEAALFHLMNQSMRDGRPLLLTARDPIASWPYLTEDLRSRARLATLLQVAPATDIELSQMLVKLFGDRQIAVDPRIIGFLLPRMERSPEEVVALVELVDRIALARGTAVTRAVASEALDLRRRARGDEPMLPGLEMGDE